MMKEAYGIPYIRVSYFGVEDMAESLYAVARFFKDMTRKWWNAHGNWSRRNWPCSIPDSGSISRP